MEVCFISQEDVSSFRKRSLEKKAELFLFGFNGIGEVNYEKELKGETAFFEELALLSKEKNGVVVSGCVTNTRGHKRRSALIAERGRVCGVSDMLYPMDGECSSGAALRVYDTKAGKMGILIGNDLYFPDLIKNLVVCGSDFILCPFGRIVDSLTSVLIRAYSYSYGVPIFLCGEGYAMFADGTGDLAFASPESPVFTKFEKIQEYHLVEMRKRGKVFLP